MWLAALQQLIFKYEVCLYFMAATTLSDFFFSSPPNSFQLKLLAGLLFEFGLGDYSKSNGDKSTPKTQVNERSCIQNRSGLRSTFFFSKLVFG